MLTGITTELQEISWTDDSFDLKNAGNYHLSIQIGLDGFSYCILDTRINKYLAFQNIPLAVIKPQFLSRKTES
ncbi:MAG TPA: DUF3822 family protein, partial [Prolixibacteraceae bacterium]|nr:DUF3822 family protein [Prolixibacteraceae bacterium]